MPPDVPSAPVGPTPAKLALFDHLPRTHTLRQEVVSVAGHGVYRLFMAIARGPAPGPILYMLDGNAAFDVLTAEMLEAAPGLTLVGVGYDTDLRFDVAARNRDYTPPLDATYPRPDPARPDRIIGGADAFIALLTGALRETAESRLPHETAQRFLWGHSLAGLCALYCMLTRPSAFNGIAVASPSLWWGDEFLLRFQRGVVGKPAQATRCLVMLGDSEKRSSQTGPHWDGPAPHTLAFVEGQQSQGRDVELEVFSGLGHAATLARSLPLSVTFAYRGADEADQAK